MNRLTETLKAKKIIADGAFGTYYAEKYETEEMPEYANISNPERVVEIHKEYIAAGATFVRTNTFASNTKSLICGIGKVKENIRAAVKCAREASSEGVFIAGDIGPIQNIKSSESDNITNEYYEIAKTFIEEGLDIICFETFAELDAILPAIERIKEEHENVFVSVSFCVNQFGYSQMGLAGKKLVKAAAEVSVIDAVGLNCGVGPGHMDQVLEKIDLNNGKFIMTLPNAGYPLRMNNRISFTSNEEYFVEKVLDIEKKGVSIIGGCCGTNPRFIKKLCERIDVNVQFDVAKTSDNVEMEPVKKNNGFMYDENGVRKDKKFIAVELAPPLMADDEKIMAAAHMLKDQGVDVLTFPDSPSGRTRIDSVLMASKVRMETGMEVMPHICCRDKNAIAIRSMLLGARINDINNLLIITGDPIPSMDRQMVKSVFNFDSVGLMSIAEEMNEEMMTDKPFLYGGAINQGRKNIEIEIKRIKKKMDAGAQFFLTQPVFSSADIETLKMLKEETGATILVGIMPLISKKNAMFMKHEIAGVNVPDEVIARYPDAKDYSDMEEFKAAGERVGIEIAREIKAMASDFCDGYYFSFPFNRVRMLEEIL